MAQAGTTLVVVEVEPWVLPASASAEVGREPIATVDAATGEAGKWGHDGTLSSTLGEHYWTELP
jgi:hypothetical protein